jgi:hypothetical protein
MEWIKEGDRVKVGFNGAQITLCHDATVLHVPQATGDSWVIKDNCTQQEHYVSEGCTITVLDRA